jgi:hypothetical protein
MSTNSLETEALKEYVIVGGCGGLLCIPAAQKADYYRAHKYMAVLGLIYLPVIVFLLY